METTKKRMAYEDVLESIKASKNLTEREKGVCEAEIKYMLEKGQIKLVPSELCSDIGGRLGVIFTWAQSPSGYHFWKKINSLI